MDNTVILDVKTDNQMRKAVLADQFGSMNVTSWRKDVKLFEELRVGKVRCKFSYIRGVLSSLPHVR